MSVKYLVSTSEMANVYFGYDIGVAVSMYDRELRKPGVSSVVLFRQDGLDRRILRAGGEGVRIDTQVRCPSCGRRHFVSRVACERVGYPTCQGGGAPHLVRLHDPVAMEPLGR